MSNKGPIRSPRPTSRNEAERARAALSHQHGASPAAAQFPASENLPSQAKRRQASRAMASQRAGSHATPHPLPASRPLGQWASEAWEQVASRARPVLLEARSHLLGLSRATRRAGVELMAVLQTPGALLRVLRGGPGDTPAEI